MLQSACHRIGAHETGFQPGSHRVYSLDETPQNARRTDPGHSRYLAKITWTHRVSIMLETEAPSLQHTSLDQYAVGDLVNAFVDDQFKAVNAVRAASV